MTSGTVRFTSPQRSHSPTQRSPATARPPHPQCSNSEEDRDTLLSCEVCSAMTIAIVLNADQINTLDLAPVHAVVQPLLHQATLATLEQQIQFQIDLPRDPNDPRELSEIPEIRLWFVRLDATYPWFPFLIDWKAGELARYTAMLVPHQFHPREGVQFNPEALELFVMHKTFTLADWLKQQGIEGTSRLKAMTQLLGYELDDGFFELIQLSQPPLPNSNPDPGGWDDEATNG
ncbi:MAG: CRR6 family NdhI maturation factor [Leptolyngbyaceae cyanobacterium bins.349]|nr:CRR6 family NdhI maturation factor [Leptolyngbyaceae cyanobacterium bins.349]